MFVETNDNCFDEADLEIVDDFLFPGEDICDSNEIE